jgi:hypothetical protein
MHRQEQLIVADEPSEQTEGSCMRDKRKRKAGLAGSRRACDQDAAVAENDGAGMDVFLHFRVPIDATGYVEIQVRPSRSRRRARKRPNRWFSRTGAERTFGYVSSGKRRKPSFAGRHHLNINMA